MIIMINGSFGVGKTTVARSLRRALPGSLIYDPEWAGVLLMRTGKWFGISKWQTDDFQDIPLWRRSVTAGIRFFRRFAIGPVIVPMTFSCREIFDGVMADLRNRGLEARVFCLKASLRTIEKRLEDRRIESNGPQALWLSRRIKECMKAHEDPHFGETVDADNKSVKEIAEDILMRLPRLS